MHWFLVRLLRAVPEMIPAGEIRAVLESRFDTAALAAEARFIANPDKSEAELMAQLIPGPTFGGWLDRFLPGLAAGEPRALFTPTVGSDARGGISLTCTGSCQPRVVLAATRRGPPDDPRAAAAGTRWPATLRPPFPTRWAMTPWSTTGWPRTRRCSCPWDSGRSGLRGASRPFRMRPSGLHIPGRYAV